MPREKLRSSFLMPHWSIKLQSWIPNKRKAKQILGLSQMTDYDFYRVLRSDPASEEEVAIVEAAILDYGKKHNLHGWKDL